MVTRRTLLQLAGAGTLAGAALPVRADAAEIDPVSGLSLQALAEGLRAQS